MPRLLRGLPNLHSGILQSWRHGLRVHRMVCLVCLLGRVQWTALAQPPGGKCFLGRGQPLSWANSGYRILQS